MQKKKIGIIVIIVAVVVVIGGVVVYKNVQNDKEKAKQQTEMKNTAIEAASKEKVNSEKDKQAQNTTQKVSQANGGAESTITNQSTSDNKPKMLTQKQLAQKEKEAAEAWKIREAHMKKLVSFEGIKEYMVDQAATALINQFPSEQKNKSEIEGKLKVIIDKTVTPEVMKEKFGLTGPEYDINKVAAEITPVDDLKFALNINTNQFVANSNKDIAIVPTNSAY
ncbi:MAG: hypothetical protein ACRDDY_01815 [Clostridium sp.]|uniref:hypothetical protein n=1 Tax=Clostridium sp. TaxID=1506 RepID=UPI003EE7C234